MAQNFLTSLFGGSTKKTASKKRGGKITRKRVFEVVRVYSRTHQKGADNLGGRFKGTPVAVAKKVATRVCRDSKIHGRCALNISIVEITPGSKGKHYHYHVRRVKRPEPVVVQHGDVVIPHKYEIIAERIYGDLKGPLLPKHKIQQTVVQTQKRLPQQQKQVKTQSLFVQKQQKPSKTQSLFVQQQQKPSKIQSLFVQQQQKPQQSKKKQSVVIQQQKPQSQRQQSLQRSITYIAPPQQKK